MYAVSVGACGRRGKTHSPVHGSRTPRHTNLSSCLTSQCSRVYVTMHPASHNALIETSDVWVKPGTMWAWRALLGIHGMSSVAVCVDFSCVPSGRLILMISAAIFWLMTGAPVTRKWLVAPASAMAMSTPILIWEVLYMVSACGEVAGHCWWSICFQACALVLVEWVDLNSIGCMSLALLLIVERSVVLSMEIVLSDLQLLVTTVLSSSSFARHA